MIAHNFDPVLINLGFLSIRWYSLAYIFGIFFGVYWGKYLIKKNFSNANLSEQNLDDYVVWAVLGIIFGGRLGYVFFYDFSFYSAIFTFYDCSWIFLSYNETTFS